MRHRPRRQQSLEADSEIITAYQEAGETRLGRVPEATSGKGAYAIQGQPAAGRSGAELDERRIATSAASSTRMLAAIANGDVEPLRDMPLRAIVICPNGVGKLKRKPFPVVRGARVVRSPVRGREQRIGSLGGCRVGRRDSCHRGRGARRGGRASPRGVSGGDEANDAAREDDWGRGRPVAAQARERG